LPASSRTSTVRYSGMAARKTGADSVAISAFTEEAMQTTDRELQAGARRPRLRVRELAIDGGKIVFKKLGSKIAQNMARESCRSDLNVMR
jgi:hypothetical protein